MPIYVEWKLIVPIFQDIDDEFENDKRILDERLIVLEFLKFGG